MISQYMTHSSLHPYQHKLPACDRTITDVLIDIIKWTMVSKTHNEGSLTININWIDYYKLSLFC